MTLTGIWEVLVTVLIVMILPIAVLFVGSVNWLREEDKSIRAVSIIAFVMLVVRGGVPFVLAGGFYAILMGWLGGVMLDMIVWTVCMLFHRKWLFPQVIVLKALSMVLLISVWWFFMESLFTYIGWVE